MDAIKAAVDGLAGMDMLVTTGGASVGDHDLVQAALAERGFELDFWKIAMRPGKPMIAGQLGSTAVLGLPGNPVSALVCATLFLLPALELLSGLSPAPPPTQPALLSVAVPANDGRADHLRATLASGAGSLPIVTPFPRQDSGMLTLLARADCLVLRAPHAPALDAGATVDVIRLDLIGI